MSDATPTLTGRSTAYAEIVALVRELVANKDAQGVLLFAIGEYGQECTMLGAEQIATAWTAANAKDARLPPRQWGAPAP